MRINSCSGRNIFVILLIAHGMLAVSQTPMVSGDEGKLIEDLFAGMKIKPPELGWILPNGDLVTEVNAKEVSILAQNSAPRVAPQIGIIAADAVPAFVAQNRIDCDQMNGEKPLPIYRYAAKMPSSKDVSQVLVLSGRSGNEIKSGHEEYKPTEAQLKPVWQDMKLLSGQKHLLHAIRQSTGQQPTMTFYTFASVYGKDGTLARQGVFLQDQTGKILGREIEEVNEDNLCDGCTASTYKDDLQASSQALNLISISSLPYPMVLQDSSTIEGRASELFTFSASGQPSHYRKYEYMVTCVLGKETN